mmetsp:Transcript_32287/g.52163  ORF Transcript_32287/g.52163 Transcript_32287/m.52163 type:complete len:395 (-) Transcript_32287:360-1544(-)
MHPFFVVAAFSVPGRRIDGFPRVRSQLRPQFVASKTRTPCRRYFETVASSEVFKVAVLKGGRSGEYEVSLKSAAAVVSALDALGHHYIEVHLLREGGAEWKQKAGESANGSTGAALHAISDYGPDVAFIAMHGADGEDGRIQGALELLDVPYQGAGVLASAVALDKLATKVMVEAVGLPVAKDAVVRRKDIGGTLDEAKLIAAAEELGVPIVVKTPKSGSSVGVEVVDSVAALLKKASEYWGEGPSYLLLEQFLPGREFTVPVLDNPDGEPEALPLIEIRPKNARFFDYKAKYTAGETDEICPAPVDEDLRLELSRLGVAAHRAVGCVGYSRTDVKLDANGRPHILEINTLPGLTSASLLPQAANVSGLTFPQLIQRLLHHGKKTPRRSTITGL